MQSRFPFPTSCLRAIAFYYWWLGMRSLYSKITPVDASFVTSTETVKGTI
ncbi:MAG: hypothetical protein AB1861_25935 [Cyanobacteriota bacterium]